MYTSGRAAIRLTVAAAAGLALAVIGVTSAVAAPTFDGRGYVDSAARCGPSNEAVVFGSTATSRVAICKSSSGQYEYRGVRLRDGAKLILPASESGEGQYIAENDGVSYMVTAKSLVVSVGERVIREEAMVDFHGLQTPKASAETSTTPLPPPLPAEVGGS